MNKNQIIRATGIKNKGPILEAINLLTKDKVLDSKKVNKQKEILTLASLGQEIIDLIIDINVANEAYAALDLKITEYEALLEKACLASKEGKEEYEKILKRKLLQKGWRDEELESFDDVLESAYRIESIYRKNICNSLIHRYSLILSEFEIKENTMEILTWIILNQIVHILSLDPHHSNSVLNAFGFPSRFENLGLTITDEIDSVFRLDDIYEQPRSKLRFILLNRFISNEALKLMTSLLSIIKLRGLDLRMRILEASTDLKRSREGPERSMSENDTEGTKEAKLGILALGQLEQIYGNYKFRYQKYVKDTDDEDRKSLYEQITDELGPNWEKNPDFVNI